MTLIIFALIVWPVLSAAERWKGYGKLFVEKNTGEVKSSLLLLFLSQAVLVLITCGLMGKPYILVASTAAWGIGDIAAAWVGRPFGRHKIRLAIADPKKSWEGSLAMAVTACLASWISMCMLKIYSPSAALIVSLIVGCVSAFVEMCSKKGTDTVNVPVMNVIILWLLSFVF